MYECTFVVSLCIAIVVAVFVEQCGSEINLLYLLCFASVSVDVVVVAVALILSAFLSAGFACVEWAVANNRIKTRKGKSSKSSGRLL